MVLLYINQLKNKNRIRTGDCVYAEYTVVKAVLKKGLRPPMIGYKIMQSDEIIKTANY